MALGGKEVIDWSGQTSDGKSWPQCALLLITRWDAIAWAVVAQPAI